MKIMKTFDCREMPEDARKVFRDQYKSAHEYYVKWWVYDEGKYHEDVKENDDIVCIDKSNSDNKDNWLYYIRGADIVSDWLFDNGAGLHEEVLIYHKW